MTILSCSAIEPSITHLFASFIFVIAFAEFILGLTDGRTLASLLCCSNFLFGLTLSQVSDIHVNKVYIYICNHPTFKLRDIMPFYVTHECAELPPSSQGRQEGSGRRATRIPSDPDATQREEPRHKLVVAMGGECDPALHPAPPKSPAELGKNPAGVSVTNGAQFVGLLDGVSDRRVHQLQHRDVPRDDRQLELVRSQWTTSRVYDGDTARVIDNGNYGDGDEACDNSGRGSSCDECDDMDRAVSSMDRRDAVDSTYGQSWNAQSQNDDRRYQRTSASKLDVREDRGVQQRSADMNASIDRVDAECAIMLLWLAKSVPGPTAKITTEDKANEYEYHADGRAASVESSSVHQHSASATVLSSGRRLPTVPSIHSGQVPLIPTNATSDRVSPITDNVRLHRSQNAHPHEVDLDAGNANGRRSLVTTSLQIGDAQCRGGGTGTPITKKLLDDHRIVVLPSRGTETSACKARDDTRSQLPIILSTPAYRCDRIPDCTETERSLYADSRRVRVLKSIVTSAEEHRVSDASVRLQSGRAELRMQRDRGVQMSEGRFEQPRQPERRDHRRREEETDLLTDPQRRRLVQRDITRPPTEDNDFSHNQKSEQDTGGHHNGNSSVLAGSTESSDHLNDRRQQYRCRSPDSRDRDDYFERDNRTRQSDSGRPTARNGVRQQHGDSKSRSTIPVNRTRPSDCRNGFDSTDDARCEPEIPSSFRRHENSTSTSPQSTRRKTTRRQNLSEDAYDSNDRRREHVQPFRDTTSTMVTVTKAKDEKKEDRRGERRQSRESKERQRRRPPNERRIPRSTVGRQTCVGGDDSSSSSGDDSDGDRRRSSHKPERRGRRSFNGRSSTSGGNSSPSSDGRCGNQRRRKKELTPNRWMKPEKFDGKGSFETFLYQFENCSRYNQWNKEHKVAYLRWSLLGNAAQLLKNTNHFTYKQPIYAGLTERQYERAQRAARRVVEQHDAYEVNRLSNFLRLHFSKIPDAAIPYFIIGATVGAQRASQMHFLWDSNRESSDSPCQLLAMSARRSLGSWNIGLRDDPTFSVPPSHKPVVGRVATYDDGIPASQPGLNFLDTADLLSDQDMARLERDVTSHQKFPGNTTDLLLDVQLVGDSSDNGGLGFTLEALSIDQSVTSFPHHQSASDVTASPVRNDALPALQTVASIGYDETLG